MEKHLASRSFFAAERYTIADIGLYAYTHVAHEGGFELFALSRREGVARAREEISPAHHHERGVAMSAGASFLIHSLRDAFGRVPGAGGRFAPQEFEQLGELARRLSAHRLDVAAVPVVEAFARRKPGSAEGDHRLEHGIGGRVVEQLRHDRLLGVGMDLEAADVLCWISPFRHMRGASIRCAAWSMSSTEATPASIR